MTEDPRAEAWTAALVAGTHQMLTSHPETGERVRYRWRCEPPSLGEIFMRRLDGEPFLPRVFEAPALVRIAQYISERTLREMLAVTLSNPDCAAELVPYFGPDVPPVRWFLDRHREACERLRADYGAAWRARDFSGMRAAVGYYHVAWRVGRRVLQGRAHDSASELCRRIRGEREGPRERARASHRLRWVERRDFTSYVQRERALLDSLARLRALPGFNANDPRELVPVDTRMRRRYKVRRGEMLDPRVAFLHPINSAGEVMRVSVHRSDVVRIIGHREASNTQL